MRRPALLLGIICALLAGSFSLRTSAKDAFDVLLNFADPDIATYPVERVTIDENGLTLRHTSDRVHAILRSITVPPKATFTTLREGAITPPGTSIGYQITTDFRHWYSFDGTSWTSSCATCFTPASVLDRELGAFLGDASTFAINVELASSSKDVPVLSDLTLQFVVPADTIRSRDTATFALTKKPGDWDGSDLALAQNCADPLVEFTITNTAEAGVGDMEAEAAYRILRNDVLEFTGSVQLAGGQSMTVTAAADGQDVTLEADQRPGHPGQQTVTKTVRNCGGGAAPLPPIAADDAIDVGINASVTFDARANDSDPDGNMNQTNITITAPPTHGEATVHAGTQDITYTPTIDYVGSDIFTYTLCDRDLLCDTADVTVTVLGSANLPPGASDDNATVEQGSAVDIHVLDNDSDPEGELDWASLAIVSGGEPQHGTAIITAPGVVTYTPAPDFTGFDSFIYRVCDALAACDSATVTVDVFAGNLPPVALPDTASAASGQPTTIAVLANDADPDGIINAATLSIAIHPGHGIATVSTELGTITYTPNSNFSGDENFAYSICDDDGACTEANITVTVILVFSPDVVNDEATAPRGMIISIDAFANDTPRSGTFIMDTVTFTPSEKLSTITFDAPSHIFVYQPLEGYVGSDTFTYTACTTYNLCGTATITVVMTSRSTTLSHAPQPQNDSVNSAQGRSVNIDVLANDTDPDGPLQAAPTIQTQPEHGTATTNIDGTISYTPSPAFYGVDTFAYVICDAVGMCAQAQVTVHINAAPIAENDTFFVASGVAATLEVLANDTDPDGRSAFAVLSVTALPEHGTATISATTLVYTSRAGFVGQDHFTYTLCDDDNACDDAVVTVTVEMLAPPIAEDDNVTVLSRDSLRIPVLLNDRDTDGELDTSSLGILTSAVGQASVDDGAIIYTPSEAALTTGDRFVYRICDNDGLCSEATVEITYAFSAIEPEEAIPEAPTLLALPETLPTPFSVPPTSSFSLTAVCSSSPQTDAITLRGRATATAGVVDYVEYSLNKGASWNLIPTAASGSVAISTTVTDVLPGTYTVLLRAYGNGAFAMSSPCTQSVVGTLAIGAMSLTAPHDTTSTTTNGTTVLENTIPHTLYLEASGAEKLIVNDTTTGQDFPLAYDPELKLWSGTISLGEEGEHELVAIASNAQSSVQRNITAVTVPPTLRVIDKTNGERILDAQILVQTFGENTSLPWGGEALPSGLFQITVSKPGYRTATSELIILNKPAAFSGSIALTPRGGWLADVQSALNTDDAFNALKRFDDDDTGASPQTVPPIAPSASPVLAVVLASWSAESQEQITELRALAQDLAGTVTITAQSTLEPPEIIERWIQRGGYQLAVTALAHDAFAQLSVADVPAFYLYAADGTSLGVLRGSHAADDIRSWVNATLQ